MEWGDYLQYMLALVFVLALIGLIAIGVKRFGIAGTIGGRRTARIAVLEAAPVDKRRRLLLIRRDNVEHLVMIGGAQDFVVETGIEHDPANKPDVTSSLRPLEPPLTSREPTLHTAPEPRRARRQVHPRDEPLTAEPTLETPREPAIEDLPAHQEEVQASEPDRGRTRPRQSEHPAVEAPAAEMPSPSAPAPHDEAASRSVEAEGQTQRAERAPRRNAPPSPAPVSREVISGQDNYSPCSPARIEPRLHSRQPNTTADAPPAAPQPRPRATAQPQMQRHPAESQQDRAPAPKYVRQPHSQEQAQKQASQRARPQPPASQPPAGQRTDPSNHPAPYQSSRQPQTTAGNDPDLLILNDPSARPRRA